MGLFDFFKNKTTQKSLDYEPNQIVDKLEELCYFKYASETDITEIKYELVDSLTKLNYLSSVSFDTSPYNSKDYRHYHFDGEDLFEEGGFIWQLEAMKTLFDKMNFNLKLQTTLRIGAMKKV
jgi:hypothetical protein